MLSVFSSRRSYVFRAAMSGVVVFVVVGWAISLFPVRRIAWVSQMPYRWQLYRRMSPVPDVVFIGSSRTAWGVDPSHVDPVLTRALGREIRSFNFGVAAGSAVVQRLAVDKILQRHPRPRLIVFGVSPRDVMDFGTFCLANEVTASVTPGRVAHLWNELTELPLGKHVILSSLVPGRDRWESLQVEWISLRDGRPLCPPGVQDHDNGWTEFTDYSPDKRLAKLPRDRQLLRKWRGQRLSSAYCHALENALLQLQQAGVATMVYEDPFPPCLREDHRSGVYVEYQRWLQGAARRFGAVMLPPVFPDAADEDFIDGAHVAPWVVSRYSAHLADKIAAAWLDAASVSLDEKDVR